MNPGLRGDVLTIGADTGDAKGEPGELDGQREALRGRVR